MEFRGKYTNKLFFINIFLSDQTLLCYKSWNYLMVAIFLQLMMSFIYGSSPEGVSIQAQLK